MKAPNRISASPKLIHEIRLARLRVAKFENRWEIARKQARLAKRRRKEAKEAARRAKKQAKLAKKAFMQAKEVLAEAQRKLTRVAKRAARTKTRKQPAAKAATAARRKKTTRRGVARSVSPPGAPAIQSVKPYAPTPGPLKGTSSVKPAAQAKEESITVPRDIESPPSPASPTPGEALI